MQTTEPITSPDRHGRAATALRVGAIPEPRVARILEETADLVETVPLYGPPAILLVGPLVLFALMVAGPFLAMLTIVAVLIVAAALVALAAAVLASPYLVVRHFGGRRSAARPDAPQLVPVHSPRVAA
jgi:hypothetical protein